MGSCKICKKVYCPNNDYFYCQNCRENSEKYVSDFSHNKILGGHAKCCKLNGFTNFEYYSKRDVKDFVAEILKFIPDQQIIVGKNEKGEDKISTTHEKIKQLAGKELLFVKK